MILDERRRRSKRDLLVVEAVLLDLLRLPGGACAISSFSLLGVAGELDDLHAVAQRARDRVEVRSPCAMNITLRQVERHVEVVVDEASSSAPGRGPPAAPTTGSPRKSAPSLSISSSTNTGLLVPASCSALHDAPRHRADVRAAMAADLGLVAHAARARARTNLRPMARAMERPSEVLPTPGGPTKQRIGPRVIRRELAHRQILEDAVLDVVEVEVVLVEDRGVRGSGRGCPRSRSPTEDWPATPR